MQKMQVLIPGLGRSPGGGNGNPLQYSCLENSTDRADWWAMYGPWVLQRVRHNWATEHSFFLFVCFCFCWALGERLGNTSASYAPLGRCPLWFSWDSSHSFFFSLELLLLFAGGSLFRSPAVWLLLGRQFLLFWGDPLVSWLFRVLTGSSLGKDFFPLGRLPVSTHSLRLHLNTFLQDISETL